jgi:cellulose synthase/poly-beta-1,6-N-acetylglucosamine synthase-like glycosyltransferase
VIPAHNEEAVIGRTLATLLRTAMPREFEVIVVCNGCSDRTAETVRRQFSEVHVIELQQASKTAALNAGIGAASGSSVLLLDADVDLQTRAARALIGALQPPTKVAAIGQMEIDLDSASVLVRSFYRLWIRHPYLENGKFAAAIALSRDALDRIGSLPDVIADDTYLKRQIPGDLVAVSKARFTVRVPRSISSLVRTRSRSYRGTAQLGIHSPVSFRERYREALGLVLVILRQPQLWAYIPVYVLVNLAALFSARRSSTGWERDLTSRKSVLEAS